MMVKVNAATTEMKLAPTEIQLTQEKIGTDITVNVTVNDVNELWQWTATVLWDPTVLNLTKVQEGSFLSNAGGTMFNWPTMNNLKQGNLSMVCTSMSAANANGTGVLATLTFKVLAVKQSNITLNDTVLNKVNFETQSTIPMEHSITNTETTTSTNSPTPSSPGTTLKLRVTHSKAQLVQHNLQ
jgi:hypothetical protein